jgi:hypothetical protein
MNENYRLKLHRVHLAIGGKRTGKLNADRRLGFWVFNVMFKIITWFYCLALSSKVFFLVTETGEPGDHHRPATSH